MSQKTNKQKNKFSYTKFIVPAYALILIFTFFSNYSRIFDKKINAGGDNAAYYILGNAIASGQGYTNIYSISKSKQNHFPPGYPAIIAGATKVAPNNIIFLKKLNGFFFFVSIGLLFLIVAKLTGNYHIAFISSLFLLVNKHLLVMSTIMMSDIPFLFFSLLCLWLFFQIDFSKTFYKNWQFFILIVLLAFTYHIRTVALALFGGFWLYLLFKKNWKYLVTITIGFIALGLPWYFRSKNIGGSSYLHQLLMVNPYRPEMGEAGLKDLIERFWDNLSRYITREIPTGIFNFVNISNYAEDITTNEWIMGILCLGVIIFGLTQVKKYKMLLLFYFIGSFAILLLWPNVWTGVRFLIYLIPILTFLFIYGISELLILANRFIKLKNVNIIYFVLVGASLLSIKSYGGEQIEKLEKQAKAPYPKKLNNYFELAQWIGKNTPDTTVVCCRKPFLFYIFSHRYTTNYKSTLDAEVLISTMQKNSVDYVVIDQLGYSSTGRYLIPAVQKYPEKFPIIKHLKEPDTYLLKFEPNLGYSGEWKEKKKHGMGTFVWNTGMKYTGQWKNNLRNGKGTLYMPNGTYMEGTWLKDKLEGIVTTYAPDGTILEKALYKNNEKIKDLRF